MSTPMNLNIIQDFGRVKLGELMSRTHTVITNMGGDAASLFPSLPIALTTVKQDLDNLTASAAAAVDGGKKVIEQRKKDRRTIEHDLNLLGAYVLKVANGDPIVVTAAGFAPKPPRVRSAPQAIDEPIVKSVEQGISGELHVILKRVKGAKHYDVQHASIVNGLPGNWTLTTVTVAREPVIIKGLTPGTTYAFQVRALGRLGYTDWSDYVTRMCI